MSDGSKALVEFGQARKLEVVRHPALQQLTPLLARGDVRRTEGMVSGKLAEGLEGDLAYFRYTERDSDGPDRHYSFTLVLAAAPESIAFIPRLSVKPRGGPLGRLSLTVPSFGAADTMASDLSRVSLESEEMKKRFEIHVDEEVGSNWVRQLFSPAFIAWLTSTQPGIAFELADGALCVYRSGHIDSQAELAALCEEAGKIAERLRGEALEEEGRLEAGTAALPDRPGESFAAKVEAGLGDVEWDQPPPDAATAIKAYRGPSMRRPEPWLWGAASLLGLLALGGLLLVGDQGFGGLLMLLAPVAAFGAWKTVVDDRAKNLGKAAFARGYAQSRSLSEENPRLFQARNMRLRFPGKVEAALAGDLPGSGRPGALLFTNVKSGKTSTAYDVVVLENAPNIVLPKDEKEVQLVRHEDTVAIYRKSKGDTRRTAADLDALLGRLTKPAAGSAAANG
jgi:hypothetical protein